MHLKEYKKVYPFDSKTKEFLLDLSIDHISELFDEWDGSILSKKDLDPDMVDYLVEAVKELPHKANIKIGFRIKQVKVEEPIMDQIKKALHNYFGFQIFLCYRKRLRLLRKAIIYLLFGLAFIYSAYEFDYVFENISMNVLKEGLFIGGWVFVWESISILFFERRNISKEAKQYKKIMQAPIVYKFSKRKDFKTERVTPKMV
jgi:hypothetical protein